MVGCMDVYVKFYLGIFRSKQGYSEVKEFTP